MAYEFPTEVSKQTGYLLISVAMPERFHGATLDPDAVARAAAVALAELELLYPRA